MKKLLLLLLLPACHRVVESGGYKVYETTWENTKSELRYRASPDLGCPPSALSFTLTSKQGKIPTGVYVEGCGRGALYQRLLRRHGPLARRTDANTVWQRMN